jgi:uncharacterized membrane protein YhaH (DUF805 family)
MLNIILKWISSTDERLNRLAFLFIILFNTCADILIWFLWPIIFDPSNVQYSNYLFFLEIPFIAFWLIASVNRFHDMNLSGWFLLFEFIPFVNLWIVIWLLVWKWTKWKNEYWADPLEELVKNT